MPSAATTRRDVVRVPIAFDRWFEVLARVVGLLPAAAYVELDGAEVEIHMGWAFQARFPRSAIASMALLDRRPLSRGVHGFAARWLVNGSGRGIVRIRLNPIQRARVAGVPVRLREVLVSVGDPAALARALTAGRA